MIDDPYLRIKRFKVQMFFVEIIHAIGNHDLVAIIWVLKMTHEKLASNVQSSFVSITTNVLATPTREVVFDLIIPRLRNTT